MMRPMLLPINIFNNFWFEKFICYGLATALILPLSNANSIVAYILMGQAHFFLCYLYQAKAGKIKLWHLPIYIGVLAFVFIAGKLYFYELMILTLTFFIIHNFFDERHLINRPISAFYALIISAFCILIVGQLLQYFYPSLTLPLLQITGSIIFSSVIIYLFNFRNKLYLESRKHDFFVFSILILLFVLELTGNSLHIIKTFAIIIIAHGSTWYYKLGIRFAKNSPKKFKTYLRDCVLLNLAVISTYYIFKNSENLQWLFALFYTPHAYYSWAMMHFITTIRVDDWQSIIKIIKLPRLT